MEQRSNAVILARVTSKAQEDEGYSLDSQLKLLQGYCENKDLNVIKVFKIAETASKEQSRKVFHELLDYISKNKIYHLTVEKTDRFTRNFRDAVAIDDWLDKDANRRLHAVKESLVLHKEAKSDVKFMWNIYVSVAKKYTDTLREEAMKGWAEKLAQGWLPGVPPPGYMTITENGKRIHVPNPDTKLLIQGAFKKYLEPNHSIASIAEEMNRMGIRTRKNRPYYKSKVQDMLTNPFYIGINHWNGKDYPGAQEPIISSDLFEKVQKKMHRGRPSRYDKHNPVLKNLIRCSNCHGIVTWQLQKGHYYGTCQRKSEACRGRKLLREDKIEEIVTAMLKELICPSSEIIDWVVEAMQTRFKTDINSNEQLVKSIKVQLERIERMSTNLYDDKLAGDITIERYEAKYSELMAQKLELEDRLHKIDQTLGQKLQQRLVLLELSQKAADLYPKKAPEQKRIIITKLFQELTYDSGAVSVIYTNFARALAQNVQKTRNVLGGTI
jgi:DNA invertase Pin-like site-specific DNA recombinase